MTTAIVPKDAYRMPADLVAWWIGDRYTCWHLNRGTHTACGRRIPTRRTDRVTRRHHWAAQVCVNCLESAANKNPAAAETATGRGADAVEPGARANLGPAREDRKP